MTAPDRADAQAEALLDEYVWAERVIASWSQKGSTFPPMEIARNVCGKATRLRSQLLRLLAQQQPAPAPAIEGDYQRYAEVRTLTLNQAAENQRLRTALEWYADPANWVDGYHAAVGHIPSNAEEDEGERARAALNAELPGGES